VNKKLIKWLLQISVTIFLLYLALRRVDTEALRGILKNTDFRLFLLIPLFLVADLWINSYRIKSLYNFYGIKTRIIKIALVKLEGGFFSLLFPLIGDAYKIQTFKNAYGSSYGKNSLVVLLDRLIFTFALTLILAPVWLLGVIKVEPILQWSILGLLLFEVLILYVLNRPVIFQLFSSLLSKLRPGWSFLHMKFETRKGYFQEIAINTIISVGRHFLTTLLYLAIAVSVLPHQDFAVGLFMLTVFSIILSRVLPVSVGGIGLREYIAVAVFPQIGILPEYAFTIALTVSFIGIFQGMAGGVSFLWNRIYAFSGIIDNEQNNHQ
jgi:hypothetical protein